MVDYTFSHNGKRICLHNVTTEYTHATDVDGNVFDITNYGFTHPEFIKATGCTTTSKLLDWMRRNKEYTDTTWSTSRAAQLFYALNYYTREYLSWSNYVESSRPNYDQIEHYCMGQANHAIWTNILNYTERTSTTSEQTSSQGFLLVSLEEPQEEEEEALEFDHEFWSNGVGSYIHEYNPNYGPEEYQGTPSSIMEGVDTNWYYTHSYSYKMEPSTFNFFRGHGDYFGLELEISTRLSNEEIQYIVTKVEPTQEPFFIFKGDSSISGEYANKVELVTVPCSPRYQRKAWALFFSKLDRLARTKGERIQDYFDVGTNLSNGLHIHVGRSDFVGPAAIKRFGLLLNQTDRSTVDLLTSISKRADYMSNGYCSPDTSMRDYSFTRRVRDITRSQHRGVVNYRNTSTVEVRLFQGVFDITHIKRSIDFVEALKDFSEQAPLTSINRWFSMKFKEFVIKSQKYHTLTKEFV